MGYLKTKQPFFSSSLLCTEMCNMFGADFAWDGGCAAVSWCIRFTMRTTGSPSSGIFCQTAVLYFQRWLYNVSHELWFQVNKTVIREEFTPRSPCCDLMFYYSHVKWECLFILLYTLKICTKYYKHLLDTWNGYVTLPNLRVSQS